jgi:mannose-6-phosphate isomerase-like protein (cupin superfamily)
MTKRILIAAFLFLSAILSGEVITEVPIDKEPLHHFAFENEYLRVFDVVVAPKTATLMHRHDRDYTFVILGDAALSNERMNEKPVHMDVKDGDIRYSKGGFAHIARNLGGTPFHNITIELKNPGKPVCGIDADNPCVKDSTFEMMQKIFATEHTVAQLTVLDSGKQQPLHTHTNPHFVVAVDDLTFENHVTDKPVASVSMKKGEFKWISVTGMNHYLKNVGNTRGRLFSIEFN